MFWIIYITGDLLSLILCCLFWKLYSGSVDVSDLAWALICSIFSWVTVFVMLVSLIILGLSLLDSSTFWNKKLF